MSKPRKAVDEVVVSLSLPHKHLSPNGRAHWRGKAAQIKKYREAARWGAYCAQASGPGEVDRRMWRFASIQAHYFFTQNRRRDQMNLIGSLKAAEDGLVDAGVLADDSGVTWLPVKVEVDKANPRVVLTIRESKP